MTEVSLDELGPVDYLVVEFPAGASNFTGEMATELVGLVDRGLIRVIDVLILQKSEDGEVEAMELSDVGDLGELELETELAELLAERRRTLAAAMEPAALPACSSGEPVGCARACGVRQRPLVASRRIPSSHHRLDRGR
jgi:hypothetical protein